MTHCPAPPHPHPPPIPADLICMCMACVARRTIAGPGAPCQLQRSAHWALCLGLQMSPLRSHAGRAICRGAQVGGWGGWGAGVGGVTAHRGSERGGGGGGVVIGLSGGVAGLRRSRGPRAEPPRPPPGAPPPPRQLLCALIVYWHALIEPWANRSTKKGGVASVRSSRAAAPARHCAGASHSLIHTRARGTPLL